MEKALPGHCFQAAYTKLPIVYQAMPNTPDNCEDFLC